MHRLIWPVCLFLATVIAACAPSAARPTGGAPLAAEGTLLRRIQDRGKIVIGIKYDAPGFGYMNPSTRHLEGFDVDLGRAIARELLGSADSVEFTQAKEADRIPYLNGGQADLILSTMTANDERAGQIDFTDAYYVAGQSLLVKSTSAILSYRDLSGFTVCSVGGTTSEKTIREKSPRAEVLLVATWPECVQALDAGRAQAVTSDDTVLLGLLQNAPDRYRIVGNQFTVEPYAGGLAKNHPETLAAVNDAIKRIKSSGEWKRIFEKNLKGLPVPSEPPPVSWRDVYQMRPSGA
jgi:putative glutamine transport system substrate-binding protein